MKIVRPKSNQPLPSHAKKVFSGVLFDVYQWEQKQFDGSVKTFEKIGRNDTVGVLATTQDKKIVLTRQEQPGIASFIGTSGGVIDDGELPFVAAKRELLEETGYVSDEWVLYDAVQPITKMDWAIFLFLAKNCKKVAPLHLDPGEKVTVMEVTFDEFLSLVVREDFRDKELALRVFRLLRVPGGKEKLRDMLFS